MNFRLNTTNNRPTSNIEVVTNNQGDGEKDQIKKQHLAIIVYLN